MTRGEKRAPWIDGLAFAAAPPDHRNRIRGDKGQRLRRTLHRPCAAYPRPLRSGELGGAYGALVYSRALTPPADAQQQGSTITLSCNGTSKLMATAAVD